MENTMTFCENCRKKVEYHLLEKYEIKEFHGKKCEFLKKIPLCPFCDEELWTPEIHDFNLKSLYESYRKQNRILSIDQMQELLDRYNIKKRPFSLAAGLGEITFTNYMEGDLPSRANAEILYNIYISPAYYKHLLEQNQNLISPVAYKKSIMAVEKLLGEDSDYATTIEKFASYIILKCGDITHLQLQKLLYYIQALFIMFFGRYAFTEDCEAWQHGPVYREIYDKYRDYRFDSDSAEENIQNAVNSSKMHNGVEKISKKVPVMTEDEKQIADIVIKVFGLYSGNVLRDFTHMELPWLKTREGLASGEHSNRIIPKPLLREYFEKIKSEYGIVSLIDVKKYADALAERRG